METRQTDETLVFGCGNPFFGDDGFGPAVIEHLEKEHGHELDRRIRVLDVGTSIRDILFDMLLSSHQPQRLIIVDAIDQPGRRTGDLFEIDTDEIPVNKVSDFSLHQFPTTNMLHELKNATRIDVRILVAQTGKLPEQVRPGLSEPVRMAIPRMCERILKILAEDPAGKDKGTGHDHFSSQQAGQGNWCAP